MFSSLKTCSPNLKLGRKYEKNPSRHEHRRVIGDMHRRAQMRAHACNESMHLRSSHAHTHVYSHVYSHVCMRVRLHVRARVYACRCAPVHMLMRTFVNMSIHRSVRMSVCMHASMHLHVSFRACALSIHKPKSLFGHLAFTCLHACRYGRLGTWSIS